MSLDPSASPVTLNGLLIDGGGTGQNGIHITSGRFVQILNTVVRHFKVGIFDNSDGVNLLVEDTISSDNSQYGIVVSPSGGTINATLNRITANNNDTGVVTNAGDTTIANSVISNNNIGLSVSGITWLAKTVISGNGTGIIVNSFTVNSYGDNYIRDNGTPVSGSLTPVTTQ